MGVCFCDLPELKLLFRELSSSKININVNSVHMIVRILTTHTHIGVFKK